MRYQREEANPDREKPKTTPAQPSTDPQEDRREQLPNKEIPDIQHQHETRIPETPQKQHDQPKQYL